ncbi:hypothetical protein, partial [Pseudomonas syringae]|uniref:hypothetical protein n=1 Tax=Pseudomonas syringae TaxID=317 RepID=UPI001C3F2D87
FLAGIFEFGEGLLHARNAHGEGGWLKELSVPRVGTVGYFCSASLDPFSFREKTILLLLFLQQLVPLLHRFL